MKQFKILNLYYISGKMTELEKTIKQIMRKNKVSLKEAFEDWKGMTDNSVADAIYSESGYVANDDY